MLDKLAFSITASLETDLILIDEVLSVGDAKFKKKSYRKMKELISNKDRTVMIVSHSLGSVQKLCDSLLWLNDGQVMMLFCNHAKIPMKGFCWMQRKRRRSQAGKRRSELTGNMAWLPHSRYNHPSFTSGNQT